MASNQLTHKMALALCLIAVTATKGSHAAGVTEVKSSGMALVAGIRALSYTAREGMDLQPLHDDLLELKTSAANLLGSLHEGVSQCQSDLVIKMAAAAGSGSHEVLKLLLAEDALSVLDGRLALALAFLDNVAQQLEDELTKSTHVGGHLTAIVFGADTTATILESADAAVKSTGSDAKLTGSDAKRAERQKRQGWSCCSGGGVNWTSSNGAHNVNIHPTGGFPPSGVGIRYTFRF